MKARQIVAALEHLAPGRPLHPAFKEIVAQGAGRRPDRRDEGGFATAWPMLEAFTHARGFLDVICRFGDKFKLAPDIPPSGWAAVLHLYGQGTR